MARLTKRLQPLPTVILVVLVLAGILPFFSGKPAFASTSPITVINPERLKLLEDVLYLMHFQQNGTFASNQTVRALFLQPILEKYKRSKFYRSFVIAFQYGVLPRLTLQQYASCDPQRIPRDPSNMSLTWHYLKNLTFDSYRDRHLINDDIYDPTNKFCDYRQGLFCRPSGTTGSCNCPSGSTLSDITQYDPANPIPQPAVLRCLVNHGSPCALIDLDHGNDPKHSTLAANMYHLIFNFDKPIPCTKDTQCRFKDNDLSTPKCYQHYQGPFHPPPPFPNGTVETWTLQLGAACTIGLYADPGSCEVDTTRKYGPLPGFVCYNFGAPKSYNSPLPLVDHRQGFCAHEYGQYGLVTAATYANAHLQLYPLFMAYVHPRTIPLRDDKLLDYYTRFLTKVHKRMFLEGVQREANESCDVQSTRDFNDVFWNYFAYELDRRPTSGEFASGASKSNVEFYLTKAIDSVEAAAASKGICRVYAYYYQDTSEPLISALECVQDPGMMDGECKKVNQDYMKIISYADKLRNFLDEVSVVRLEQIRENRDLDVDEEILRDNPEIMCTPSSTLRHSHAVPSDAGECPEGFVCVEDYGSHRQGLYDASCKLNTALALNLNCLEERDGIEYGMCEVVQLEKMISQNIPAIEAASNLGLGDTCVHKVERVIRSWIRDGKNGRTNKYKVLAIAETVVSFKRLFCNATRLLECTSENKCECVESTAPRRFPDNDNGIEGDYCFLTKGSCSEIDLSKFVPLTPNELGTASEYYGESKDTPGNFCKGNLCWHLDTDREICREREGTGDKEKGTGAEFAGVADLRGRNTGSWICLAAAVPFFM